MPDPAQSHTSLVGIGALLRQLQPDFPELTASKVRFLEDQGLVRPHRSPSGYRKYSPTDVRRLETVLRLQSERYLPLRVIRERLDRGEDPAAGSEPQAGHGAEAPAPPEAEPKQASAGPVRWTGRRFTLREVAARTNTDVPLVRDLLNHGLIVERGGCFDDYALTVAAAAKRLGTYGIEPRHLRTLRAASERMMGLVEGSIAPLLGRRDPVSRRKAPQRAREISSLCLTVISALVNSQLNDTRPFEQER